MSVYRIDVPVWATAYVQAESPEAAMEALGACNGQILGVGPNSLLDPAIVFSDVATIYTDNNAARFGDGVCQPPEECDDEDHPEFEEA